MPFTKFDVVDRQTSTAIRLLFNGDDFIAVNTLGSAAFRVLYDLSKKKGHQFHLRFDDLIVPGKERVFWDFFNRISEFSKHADRKPDEVLKDYDEKLNDFMLFFCCLGWLDSGKPLPRTMHIYWSWFVTGHPEILKEGFPMRQEILNLDAKGMSRALRLEAGRRLLAASDNSERTLRVPRVKTEAKA